MVEQVNFGVINYVAAYATIRNLNMLIQIGWNLSPHMLHDSIIN